MHRSLTLCAIAGAIAACSLTAARDQRPEEVRLPPPAKGGPEATVAASDPAYGLNGSPEPDDFLQEVDEEGSEGGVEGGVVGGVVGGVLGGTVAASPAPSSPPAPPVRQNHVTFKAEKAPIANKPAPPREPQTGGNTFVEHRPNPFVATKEDKLSTFSIDVDTASYTLMRRYLNNGSLPPGEAVRVEEHVNYFKYKYPGPTTGAFSVHLEGAPSPFTPGHHLVRVGVQGKIVAKSQRKPAHLTFLVDTSGSMYPEDRLPLAKEAMKLAIRNLNENDTVAIVTYAGNTAEVLPTTPASNMPKILQAIETLESGGGTAMGSGMELAYRHAVKRAAGNVTSRVIVLTDGDTNIGPNLSADSMLESVRKYVQEGVTLTMVGFGMGNYRDDLMEKLADKGNGNCFYVDGMKEARKVFETRLTGTLEVIAKDVKIQVEFDPAAVKTYRLIGYENRDIADADFRNDKVDAGEIGAGHSVTAFYEVQLSGKGADLGTVRIRAKTPSGTTAQEQAFALTRAQLLETIDQASADFRFALAVAGTADILRHNQASESWSLALAEKLAKGATDGDPEREEFVRLLGKARQLWNSAHPVAAR